MSRAVWNVVVDASHLPMEENPGGFRPVVVEYAQDAVSLDRHMMPMPNVISSAVIAAAMHPFRPRTHLCRLALALTELLLQTVC